MGTLRLALPARLSSMPGSLPTSSRTLSKAWAAKGVPDVVSWEVLSIGDGATVRLVFEAAKPGQGVWLASDGGFELEGAHYGQLTLWQETAPREVSFIVRTGKGLLHFYNVWHDSRAAGNRGSQSFSSGMRCEAIPEGFRYRCNSIGFDPAFDHLVFRVEFEQRLYGK